MNNPLLFSEEEKAERYKLRQFLHTHFVFRKKQSKHFTDPLTGEFLFQAFCNQCGRPEFLSEGIVSMFLDTGGYTLNEGLYWCDLNMETVTALNTATRLHLIKMANKASSIALTKEILGQNNTPLVREIAEKEALLRFLQYMCFTVDNVYYQRIQHKYVSSSRLFDYYNQCVEVFNLPTITRTMFYKLLKEQGFVFSKGYCDGKAGITRIGRIVIPTTADDVSRSLRTRCGVISFKHSVFTTLDINIVDYTEYQLQQFTLSNKEKWSMYEQKRTEETTEETKAETNDEGGRDKVSTPVVGNKKKALSSAIPVPIHGESKSDDAEVTSKPDPRTESPKQTEQSNIIPLPRVIDDEPDIEPTVIEDATTIENSILSLQIPFEMGAIESVEDVDYYLKMLPGGSQWRTADKVEILRMLRKNYGE